MKCAICGKEFGGIGNIATPLLSKKERVCDRCNRRHVIPIRKGVAQRIVCYNGRTVEITHSDLDRYTTC